MSPFGESAIRPGFFIRATKNNTCPTLCNNKIIITRQNHLHCVHKPRLNKSEKPQSFHCKKRKQPDLKEHLKEPYLPVFGYPPT